MLHRTLYHLGKIFIRKGSGNGSGKGSGKGGSIKDAGGPWAERQKAMENRFFKRQNNEDLEKLKKSLIKKRKLSQQRKIQELEADKIRSECAKEKHERNADITDETCKIRAELDKEDRQKKEAKGREGQQTKKCDGKACEVVSEGGKDKDKD